MDRLRTSISELAISKRTHDTSAETEDATIVMSDFKSTSQQICTTAKCIHTGCSSCSMHGVPETEDDLDVMQRSMSDFISTSHNLTSNTTQLAMESGTSKSDGTTKFVITTYAQDPFLRHDTIESNGGSNGILGSMSDFESTSHNPNDKCGRAIVNGRAPMNLSGGLQNVDSAESMYESASTSECMQMNLIRDNSMNSPSLTSENERGDMGDINTNLLVERDTKDDSKKSCQDCIPEVVRIAVDEDVGYNSSKYIEFSKL